MKRLLLSALIVACAAVSCSAKPRLSLAEVRSVLVGTRHPRDATRLEISELVAAYNKAVVLKDQEMGTTPEVSVDVLLESGETLRIAGGYEGFQIVILRHRQVNVSGKDLAELLRRFMHENPQ